MPPEPPDFKKIFEKWRTQPPDPPREKIPFAVSRNRRIAAIATFVILLAYAGVLRWLFGAGFQSTGGVVSLTFLWTTPVTLGALSVAIGRWCGSDEWFVQASAVPFIVLNVAFLIVYLSKVEAAMCIIMAAPVMYGAALVGGMLAHMLLPKNKNDYRLQVTFIVFVPFLAAMAESAMEWPTEIKAIRNTIDIRASPEEIWKEIASVRAIAPEELANRWIYWVDFPRPIAATLDREGVGGVRTATFERGVSFFEEVTVWDRPRKLAFTIHADPDFIPHTAFDQHIIVGGRFYDVLDGIYQIEPVDPGTCRLHLTSHHRLTTRFNSYAGWWSEKIMDQIQGSILEVIRRRAEDQQRITR